MDRAAIVACPIMVVGVVMSCGTAQPSTAASCLPRLEKLIVSAYVAFGSADIRSKRNAVAMSALCQKRSFCSAKDKVLTNDKWTLYVFDKDPTASRKPH